MYIGLHVKCLLFMSDYDETWIFSIDFLKINEISIFMIICLVEADLFHVDRQRDIHDEAISRFWH